VTAVTQPVVRYTSADEDSARWNGFRFRDGDIVISTRSKSGTTWMQMICALLVFRDPELPGSLPDLSPWVDHSIEPIDDVRGRLERQAHRRFVKTHTPLDGVPLDPRASYVVVARHPLDMAVSLYHQGANIDRERLRALTGSARPQQSVRERPSLHDWLVEWVAEDFTPQERMDSLPGVLHHLSDAWARRTASNIRLVHYDDLHADLEGEMRRLAAWLGIEVPAQTWPALVDAARFASMRSRAETLTPNRLGVLKDTRAFFRSGGSGEGSAVLDDDERVEYHRRAASLAPADLLAWLHRGQASSEATV
jgi:aryl sulfotransferase